MKIVNNGYSIEVKKINGIQCLSLVDLAKLDGHNYTEFCRKVRTEPSIKPFIIRERESLIRKTHLRIEGCVKLIKMFKFPNDELVRKLLPLMTVKKPTAEEIVDKELKNVCWTQGGVVRLEGNEVTTPKEFDVKIVEKWEQPVKELKDLVEKVDSRLIDVENSLSYINDKPNQQDTSFRTLLKECIKEIIREELMK